MHPTTAQLLSIGVRVFPVHPTEKRPLVKGWQQLATSDPDEFATWDAQFDGRYRLGIATAGHPPTHPRMRRNRSLRPDRVPGSVVTRIVHRTAEVRSARAGTRSTPLPPSVTTPPSAPAARTCCQRGAPRRFHRR